MTHRPIGWMFSPRDLVQLGLRALAGAALVLLDRVCARLEEYVDGGGP